MRAVGLVRTSVSADPNADEDTIRSIAASRGYELCGILHIRPNTYLPTVLTVQTVHEHRAAAVIAPALRHLGGTERAVALACDVVTQRQTVRRTGNAGPG